MTDSRPPTSELILYQTEDGRTRIQCRFDGDTLWLTQAQIAELFQVTPQNVTQHLGRIFESGELSEEATCKDYLQVRTEGNREVKRQLRHYNLPAILAVGYRVESVRGTQFRQWATARLGEFLVKGFTMDDERLKNPPGPGQQDYFDELLERIRDIRASERRFYQKVLDIYATSIDYQADADLSQQFFATVQNKMHFAAHGHTAAEVIVARADGEAPMMGLTTTRTPGTVRREDAQVAKNYLSETELSVLNRIVTMYLDFAELQALDRKPMTMRDWIVKLDEFLKTTGRPVLTDAGKVSAEAAKTKAEEAFRAYREKQAREPAPVDDAFERATKALPSRRGKKP
ncbi:MAG: virulence RhuM family protein [Polyangiaceae bacterium]